MVAKDGAAGVTSSVLIDPLVVLASLLPKAALTPTGREGFLH